MPYVDADAITEAKEVDLLTYLQHYDPQELVPLSNNAYCTKTHHSLKISNGKWYWHSRGFGGRSALDYLIKVKGLSFPEAVQQIIERAASQPPVFLCAPQEVQKASFSLPKRDCSQSMLEWYLHQRGISYEIIHHFLDSGTLYQNYNKGFRNLIFVGKDPQNIPRFASIRGITSDFKGDAPGSDKRYSFSYSNPTSKDLHVFESAIDLISYATMQRFKSINGFPVNMLSLSGIFPPKQNTEFAALPPALSQYLADYPHINHIHLHLDTDLAGRQASEAIIAVLPKAYTTHDEPPLLGKDYNDFLLHQSRFTQERSDISRS